jgi:hypothetical protein
MQSPVELTGHSVHGGSSMRLDTAKRSLTSTSSAAASLPSVAIDGSMRSFSMRDRYEGASRDLRPTSR